MFCFVTLYNNTNNNNNNNNNNNITLCNTNMCTTMGLSCEERDRYDVIRDDTSHTGIFLDRRNDRISFSDLEHFSVMFLIKNGIYVYQIVQIF